MESSKEEEDIVISGMSVRLPECDDVTEFWENLWNGVDMVTEDDRRWPPGLHNLPRRNGKLKTLSKFDSSFFGVTPKQAETMDPQLRILLEVTYEALVDSGHSMQDIGGTTTGVFIGSTFSDAHDLLSSQTGDICGYEMTGCNRAMLANRLSYMFDLKGPSMTIDTACSSGLQSLCLAFSAIRQGRCDSAIVGGVNLLLKPETSMQFMKLNMLSPDGACKAFDETANGYCRSEGVVALLLEKKSVCRRNYMTIKAVLDNVDGYKPQGISFPSGGAQRDLQERVYKMAGIDPNDVTYIEAHGTGTQAGDVVELGTIEETFCKDKVTPLLVGSVKSNMGHTEAASGLASIVKVILSHQHKILPANLHFSNPNPKIAALYNNKIKVVSRNTTWDGGIVGVNSFGFGGANVHAVLQTTTEDINSNSQHSILTKQPQVLPHLLIACGRTEDGVGNVLKSSSIKGCERDYMALVHAQAIQLTAKQLVFRGFSIMENDVLEIAEADINQSPRPVWFVYPGMGCQWQSMGQDMLDVPQFRNVIQICQDTLEKVGYDLISVIESRQDEVYQEPLNAFVAICAIQIALTVLLKGLGLSPDGILGHSVGELACAFADDTLSIEQTILAAYWRGRCVQVANLPEGSMAAVGLTWNEAKNQCPDGIVPACHNAKQTVTISGPKDKVHNFVEDLKSKGIFAREVNSSGIAFHSYVMQKCGPSLLAALQKVIPEPKPISKRWISTSVPMDQRDTPQYQVSSAEYHVNNLLSPVLFKEGLEQLPGNALVIEIGPHGLLQALLRRELSKDTALLSTMKKNEDNRKFFLTAVGRCFIHGKEINLPYLYGDHKYPVSCNTPCISPFISWQHDEDWFVPKYTMQNSTTQGTTVKIDSNQEPYQYLKDHVIDGRVIYPIAGYVIMVWETFAKKLGKTMNETNVTIQDLRVHDATIIGEEIMTYSINISKTSGVFEISTDEHLKCTGTIQSSKSSPMQHGQYPSCKSLTKDDILLNKDDIYKELRLCGYEYGESFQRVMQYKTESREGILEAGANWVTLIDCLLHVILLDSTKQALKLPTRIRELTITPGLFESDQEIHVKHNPHLKETSTTCLKIKSVQLTTSQRRAAKTKPILCSYRFYPYMHKQAKSLQAKRRLSLEKNCLHTISSQNQHSVVDVRSQSARKSKGMFLQYLENKQTERDCDTVDVVGPFSLLISAIDICVENLLKHRISVGCIIENSNGLELIQNIDDITKYYPHVQLSIWVTSTDKAILAELQNFSDSLSVQPNLEKSLIKTTDIVLVDETYSNGKLADVGLDSFIIFYTNKCPEHDPETLEIMVQMSESNNNNSIAVARQKTNIRVSSSAAEVVNIEGCDFEWVAELKEKLAKVQDEENGRVWLVDGVRTSGIVGMVNCFLQEPAGDKIRCISDGYLKDDHIQKDLVMNIYKHNSLGSYRRIPLSMENIEDFVPDAYLDIINKGDLNTLRWIQLGNQTPSAMLQSDDKVIHVTHSGLNFRDVMVATGRLTTDALPNVGEAVLGLEFSGIDKDGNRRMGISMGKSMATRVTTKSYHTWSVPGHWSLAAAASVPVAYATAYYTLVVRANITKDKTVLVHSAGSSVGLAAIRVAQAQGCRVFVTAGTEEKRKYLIKHYQIPPSHVSNSRSLEFVNDFLSATKGKGLDVILNPLSDEKLMMSLDILAENGHFLEIGKYDLSNDTPLGMSIFLKNISFHGVQIETLMDSSNAEWKRVHKLIEDGIHDGVVVPLNLTVFQHSEIEQAFRYMAEGKHIGKIVIQIKEEHYMKDQLSRYNGERLVHFPIKQIKALRRVYFNPKKVYIVTGGLGGLGLELTNWMICRGAKQVVFTSRTGIKTGYQKRMIRKWTEKGVKVTIRNYNVVDAKETEMLFKEVVHLGEIGGVFHLAAILHDALFDVQTPKTFERVINIKAKGIDNLDKMARLFSAESLDYFVAFSSAAAAYGNAGQTNYAYGNSYMERVCEQRVEDGFPAKAIQWGFIGDVGIVQDSLGGNKLYHMGMVPQRIPSFLEVLELFMLAPGTVYSSVQPASKQQTSIGKGVKDKNNSSGMVNAVMNIIGVKDPSKINKSIPLIELGLDSLMVTEIRQVLGRNFDINLSVTEVQELCLSKLYELDK